MISFTKDDTNWTCTQHTCKLIEPQLHIAFAQFNAWFEGNIVHIPYQTLTFLWNFPGNALVIKYFARPDEETFRSKQTLKDLNFSTLVKSRENGYQYRKAMPAVNWKTNRSKTGAVFTLEKQWKIVKLTTLILEFLWCTVRDYTSWFINHLKKLVHSIHVYICL